MRKRLRSRMICAGLLSVATSGSASAIDLMMQQQTTSEAPFTEEASTRGLAFTMSNTHAQLGAGVCFADLDNDLDADIVLAGAVNGAISVFENNGAGYFALRSNTGMAALTLPSAITAADYDGDGDLDIHISVFNGADRLMRNNGAFTFTNVAPLAGVNGAGAGQGVAWGDYDGDGWLDFYVANRTYAINPIVNRLYRNNCNGTFTETATASGVTCGDAASLVPILFDYDMDGDMDLYVGHDKGTIQPWHNDLFRNDGGTFTDVSVQTGTALNIDCMGIAAGDLNYDNLLDMYLTNIENGNVLLFQQPGNTFVQAPQPTGVTSNLTGWATFFFDFDNDAWQEIYVCNTLRGDGIVRNNRLFNFDGDWPAVDLAADLGVATPEDSYTSAYADIDGDGDLDFMVERPSHPILLFINHTDSSRNWVRLNVIGRNGNRFAVGARVSVRTGLDRQHRQIIAGNNYKSMNELIVHVGLNQAEVIDEIQVTWPEGDTRVLTGYAANRLWMIHPSENMGDADGDGELDSADLAVFAGCMSGPEAGELPAGCEVMDMDCNARIDLADYAVLQFLFAQS